MNIYTVKLSKKKIVAAILAVAVIIGLIILMVPGKSRAAEQTIKVKNTAEQLEYITSLGYEVETEPIAKKEVVIPDKFDDVYTKYNNIQKECGFDLADFKGKKVMLFCYRVTNYGCDGEVLLELLTRKDKVVGGAVYTTALDGFMHGLKDKPIS